MEGGDNSNLHPAAGLVLSPPLVNRAVSTPALMEPKTPLEKNAVTISGCATRASDSSTPLLTGDTTETTRRAINVETPPHVKTTVVDGRVWTTEFDPELVINGLTAGENTPSWKMIDQYSGKEHAAGSDADKKELEPIDFFMAVFPKKQLLEMVENTNRRLANQQGTKEEPPVTAGGVLSVLGIVVLMSRFELVRKEDLWDTPNNQWSKYVPMPDMEAKSGISVDRWQLLWRNMEWSPRPVSRPDDVDREDWHGWMNVEGFVSNINEHRATHFTPSGVIGVDDSICRSYGLGSGYIDTGIHCRSPLYERPEEDCGIQVCCDAASGAILSLRFACRGGNALLDLIGPFRSTGRIVVADSYFSSVESAVRLQLVGVGFIGRLVTEKFFYPMEFLKHQTVTPEVRSTTNSIGVVSDGPSGCKLLAFVWGANSKRFFISTAESLAEGRPSLFTTLQRVDSKRNETIDPHNHKQIRQPRVVQVYLDTMSKISDHNCLRRDHLMLERKVGSMLWHQRVNTSLLAMMVVDSYLLWRKCQNRNDSTEYTQARFYEKLAEQLIDNNYDHKDPPSKKRKHRDPTPTKRKKPSNPRFRADGRCFVCKRGWSGYECRYCSWVNPSRAHWICHSKDGNHKCYSAHLKAEHPNILNNV